MEKKELEDRVVSKVAEVISSIKNAKHVDHVISSLLSIATLLFPLDLNLLSGSRFFNPTTQQFHFILFIFHYTNVFNFAGSVGDDHREQVCVRTSLFSCHFYFCKTVSENLSKQLITPP